MVDEQSICLNVVREADSRLLLAERAALLERSEDNRSSWVTAPVCQALCQILLCITALEGTLKGTIDFEREIRNI